MLTLENVHRVIAAMKEREIKPTVIDGEEAYEMHFHPSRLREVFEAGMCPYSAVNREAHGEHPRASLSAPT